MVIQRGKHPAATSSTNRPWLSQMLILKAFLACQIWTLLPLTDSNIRNDICYASQLVIILFVFSTWPKMLN